LALCPWLVLCPFLLLLLLLLLLLYPWLLLLLLLLCVCLLQSRLHLRCQHPVDGGM
jgi:hypothetical protein